MSAPWYVTALAWFSLVDCMLLLLAIGILLGRKLAPNFRRVRQVQGLRRRISRLSERVEELELSRFDLAAVKAPDAAALGVRHWRGGDAYRQCDRWQLGDRYAYDETQFPELPGCWFCWPAGAGEPSTPPPVTPPAQ